MTDAPPPAVYTSLKSFAYAPRGPWFAGAPEPVDVAEEYHEASKIAPDFPGRALGPGGRRLSTTPQSHLELGRKALAYFGPRVPLPEPAPLPIDLTYVAQRRRSGLPERTEPVSLTALGTVLGLSSGRSATRPDLRVTPSGGAMYPIDLVVIAHRVAGLPAGAYVYDPVDHALLARTQLEPQAFHSAAGGSGSLAPPQPAITVALVATFARTRVKYGLRGYRFALLEAGHLAQAMITTATSIGLATLPWGGFIDAAADRMLELDGLERSCIYLVAISAESCDDVDTRACESA